MVDEALKLRLDRDDDEATATQAPGPGPAGAITRVGITKTVATYPTTAGAFYAMQSAGVMGAQVEGGAGIVTGKGDTWYALNLGSAIPPVGTKVLCTFIKYRWVFRHD